MHGISRPQIGYLYTIRPSLKFEKKTGRIIISSDFVHKSFDVYETF